MKRNRIKSVAAARKPQHHELNGTEVTNDLPREETVGIGHEDTENSDGS
jgi:hypothetical protein